MQSQTFGRGTCFASIEKEWFLITSVYLSAGFLLHISLSLSLPIPILLYGIYITSITVQIQKWWVNTVYIYYIYTNCYCLQVPLGILLKNGVWKCVNPEASSSVCTREYTDEVHVPSIYETDIADKAVLVKLLLGGDQLTATRARGVLKSMLNATSASKRLEQFTPV